MRKRTVKQKDPNKASSSSSLTTKPLFEDKKNLARFFDYSTACSRQSGFTSQQ
jgi:hypothetical protein